MIITALVGVFMGKRKKDDSTKKFFVADKSLGVWLTGAMMFGEMIGGSSTVGSSATAFSLGLSAVWSNWGMAIGVLVFLFTVAKFYRRASHFGVMSVPEAFHFRFDERARIVVLIITLVVYGIIYSQQPVAAATLLEPILNIDKTILTWAMGFLFAYMALSGLKGVAGQNLLHSIVMFIGLFIVSIVVIIRAGGLADMRAALPAQFFDVSYPDIFTVLAQVSGSAISMLLSATVVGCCIGAKSLKVAKKGLTLSVIFVIPFALMPAIIGIAGRILLPEASSNNIIYTVAQLIHPAFAGIVAMSVLAAIIGPGILLALATSLTRDFYLIKNPDATQEQQMRFSKYAIIALAIITTAFGLNTTSILSQILGAFQIRSIAGIILIVGLTWKRTTNTGVFWSMLIGGIVAALWHFTENPLGWQPFYPATVISLIILIVLSFANKEKISADYQRYYDKIKDIPDDII